MQSSHTSISVPSFVRIEKGSDGGHDFKINMVLLFARKPGNINVSRSAAPKQALMPASCFTAMSISQFSMSVPSFIRIERGSDGGP